jgi:hypothetical protein
MSDESMDDQFERDDQSPPAPPSADPPPARWIESPVEYFDRRRSITAWQRAMLRRLAALLCTGTLAFTLTTWVLVQRERHAPAAMAVPPGQRAETGGEGAAGAAAGGEPVQTARAQLEALNRGDAGAAYEMFSPDYRKRVPLEGFKALVASHRAMFRTEEEEMDTVAVAPDRVRIDLHVQSEDDEEYVAHYTLARVKGRWYVDDLRWVNAEDEDEGLTSA